MFASLYHAHHQLYREDIPFWLDLARQQGGDVLELGCGTGRVSLPLADAGIRLVGLDLDREMLVFFLNYAPRWLQRYSQVFQADFTRFHLGHKFGLIFLPCNTYSIVDEPSRRLLLACVFEHLAPGGRFAVSLPNPALLRRFPAQSAPEVEEIFPHPLDGEPVQVSSEWRRTRQEFYLTWHYDHLLPDGRVERLSIPVLHHLTPVEDHLTEFHTVGFRDEQLFGDWDGSLYDATSTNLILVATRPS